jgi:CubicO group peptidase (beta-lactamase class C family)
MHSLLLLHKDKLIAEGYYAPYTADTLHRMFSISKSFSSIAIGLLEAEGQLALSDKICDYFSEYVSEDTHPWILEMTIRDMLMMRTCHAATTYKINMQSDWVESFFKVAPTHPSGKLFHYDTSSAHTLCALVEKLTCTDLLSYIKKKLAPLGFSEESYMIKDPFGVSMGGSGLVAKPMDILKFGYLLMHEGLGLVPAEYIRQATANLTPTSMTAPLPSESCGYGYQIWRNERGGFVCYGMGGQFVICLPEHDLICVTTADTQGMAGGNQLIYDAFYEEILDHITSDALPENAAAQQELNALLENLAIAPLNGSTHSSFAGKINSKAYQLIENPTGFSKISVEFCTGEDNGTEYGVLHYTLHEKDCELHFGIGNMQYGTFPLYNMKYAASAEWLAEDTLYIRAHIIDEYVGSVRFELTFGDKDVTVFMRKVEESLFSEFNGHLYGTIN